MWKTKLDDALFNFMGNILPWSQKSTIDATKVKKGFEKNVNRQFETLMNKTFPECFAYHALKTNNITQQEFQIFCKSTLIDEYFVTYIYQNFRDAVLAGHAVVDGNCQDEVNKYGQRIDSRTKELFKKTKKTFSSEKLAMSFLGVNAFAVEQGIQYGQANYSTLFVDLGV